MDFTMKYFSTCLVGVFLLTEIHICLTACICGHVEMACNRYGLTRVPRCRRLSPEVRIMNLSGNRITSIGPAAFMSFPKMKVLDLHSNSLKVIPCSAFSFQDNLIELDLGNNEIPSLRCQIQSRSSEHLLLDYFYQTPDNKVDMFYGLVHLRTLSVSNNMLTALHNNAFASLKSLKVLGVENNQINVLERDAFKGLHNLNQLDLSGNKLTSIKPWFFKGLPEIKVLKLHGNHIQRIERNAFKHCKQITKIDLSGNPLRHIEKSAFHYLTHLNALKLNNNQISSLDPCVFDSSTQLSYVGVHENPWHCSCERLLWLKRWLESSGSTVVTVFVKCSQPETLRGRYLDVMSSALTRGAGSMCSCAELHVEPRTTPSESTTRNTWMTKQHVSSSEKKMPRVQRRVGRTVARQLIRHIDSGDVGEMLQYRKQPASGTLLGQRPRTGENETTSESRVLAQNHTPNVQNLTNACVYNEQLILNLEAVTVTSDSVSLRWTVRGKSNTNAYFRVMYDQFDTKTKFSRFVNVKQGMSCKLSDLRPETPYFLCVESVVDERVCPVASRDLCVGVVTKAQEGSGPEPQTVILIFTGINSLAIVAILGVLACLGQALQRRLPHDAVSLIYAQNRCGSCTVCAIQMSDLNSAVNTNSSNTGTYQPNDIDHIDLPPVH